MIKGRALVQRAETLVPFAFVAATGLTKGRARAGESAILPSVPQAPRALDLPLSARRICASWISRRIPGKQIRERTLGEVDTGEKAKSPGAEPTKGKTAGSVGPGLSPPGPVGAPSLSFSPGTGGGTSIFFSPNTSALSEHFVGPLSCDLARAFGGPFGLVAALGGSGENGDRKSVV